MISKKFKVDSKVQQQEEGVDELKFLGIAQNIYSLEMNIHEVLDIHTQYILVKCSDTPLDLDVGECFKFHKEKIWQD